MYLKEMKGKIIIFLNLDKYFYSIHIYKIIRRNI